MKVSENKHISKRSPFLFKSVMLSFLKLNSRLDYFLIVMKTQTAKQHHEHSKEIVLSLIALRTNTTVKMLGLSLRLKKE